VENVGYGQLLSVSQSHPRSAESPREAVRTDPHGGSGVLACGAVVWNHLHSGGCLEPAAARKAISWGKNKQFRVRAALLEAGARCALGDGRDGVGGERCGEQIHAEGCCASQHVLP